MARVKTVGMLHFIQRLDNGLVTTLNHTTQGSPVLDTFMTKVLLLPSFKVFPIVLAMLAVSVAAPRLRDKWSALLTPLAGGFAALVVTRLMQNLMPERPRPMHEPTLHFVLPAGVPPETLSEWSSFPSDTTALAFALAAGVWCRSRALGTAALVWAALFVGLPRIFAGFHYPSDIVAGALIGVAMTLGLRPAAERFATTTGDLIARPALQPLVCGLVFAVLFQTVMMFDDVRVVARIVSEEVGAP